MKPKPKPGKHHKPRTNPRHDPLAPESPAEVKHRDEVDELLAERADVQGRINAMRDAGGRPRPDGREAIVRASPRRRGTPPRTAPTHPKEDDVSPCESPMAGVIVCGPGPMKVVYREPHGEGHLWCFQCRKRVPFEFIVRRSTAEMDWYGPSPSVECAAGHKDGDLFPGRVREWDS